MHARRPTPGVWPCLLAVTLLLAMTAAASGCSSGRGETTVAGTVEARQVDVNTKVPGRVARLLVREGREVRRGQVVAEIDRRELEAKEKEALAAVEAAKATVEKARAAMKAAEAALNKASAALTVSRETSAALVGRAEAALKKAQEDLALAEKSYQRVKSLYDAGAATAQQMDEASNRLEAARAALRVAEADLRSARAAAGEVSVREAEVAAARAQRAACQADLVAAEAAHARAVAALEEVRTNLEETVITAPADGTVSVINVEEGEIVSAGLPLLTVTDYGDNWVNVKVPETLLAGIHLNQRVRVTAPGLPDRVFSGVVESISRKPEFATFRATNDRGEKDIVSYRVKVRLNEPRLWPGMSVDVHLGRKGV